MKKKLLALLSLGLLVFASVNTTACSSDDDDDNSNLTVDTLGVQEALKQGSEDGLAYATVYAEVKAGGVAGLATVEGITNLNTMVTYGKKYKNNQSKTYKAAFVAGASGIGDASAVTEMLENSTTVSALTTLLKNIFSAEGNE